MRYLIIPAFLALLIGFSSCSEKAHDQNDTAQADAVYTCPMHPSVISDRPGACPVCGMALVKKSAMKDATEEELDSLAKVSLSPTQRVLANIQTVVVRSAILDRSLRVTGIAEPAQSKRAVIAARFAGRIGDLAVAAVGESVRKGQPLFHLYSPDLISAQQEYILALRGRETGSSQILASSRERLMMHFGMTESQINRLVQSGEIQSTVSFHAPLAGTVLARYVSAGQYVEEGMALYDVADLSTVWAYFEIYEKDIHALKPGNKVRVRAAGITEGHLEGSVTLIEPAVEAETRTVRVRVELPNPDGMIKPGTFLNGTIRIPQQESLVVPVSSVLSLGTRTVVWVEVRPNAFEPRMVTTGATDGNEIQILTGLRAGERVASTGGYLIDSESALQNPGQFTNGPAHGHTTPPPSGSTDGDAIDIYVKGSYSPETIHLRAGREAHLRIYRDEKAACTEEILFPDFGITAKLAAFDTTHVRFTPRSSGTFAFSCGMEMIHGTIIVH